MNKKYKIVDNRLFIFKIFVVLSFLVLIVSMLDISLVNAIYYKDKLKVKLNNNYKVKSSLRGRIYDRNHNLLVDDKIIPIVSYVKPNKVSSLQEVAVASVLSNILDINYSKVTDRMLRDYYLANNSSDNLITEEEWRLYKNRKLNDNDIYKLKIDRISKESISNYSKFDKKRAYIYYLMNNGYSYEEKVIKSNLTDREIAGVIDIIDNLNGINISYTYERIYPYKDTFKSILGKVSSIPVEEKDKYISLGYDLNSLVGVSYIEKEYEEYLKGENGVYSIDNGNIINISDGKRGKDVVLTIDIKLQKRLEELLDEELINTKSEPNTNLFNSIYVVIKNPKNGEILAMSGRGIRKINGRYETYDITTGVLTNSFTPGSVVKGASILVGYKEKAIDINSYLKDECIKIYSKPKKCSWANLGYVNDINALAMSSNVYQFKTALKVAGIDYKYNMKEIDVSEAFKKYRTFFNDIGLGSKSGIDLPVDGIGNVGTLNNIDLYLNYVIGQYDTYTTMQLSEYVSTIANYGKRVYPHLLLEVRDNDLKDLVYTYEPRSKVLDIDKKYVNRVRTGFKEVMSSGLGKNFMGEVSSPSGKTGTSESFYDSNNDGRIDTPTLTNAFVGYYPSNNPKMSIAIVFPNLVDANGNGSERSYANKRITRKVVELFSQLYD
ncbi:MAG: penicillin-binding protein 2 [Bacilli bacterium]|nr:penicillin-binding protein 2 [Bacilli bacterium]